ncbi:CYTH and CHAD domain-containing protein [Actinomadura sp. NEAU-AAG7]|uniref:CYTH and CHAD domain-containing protein n=1 Tax=Actinomadura sp. NEAU-AAG7 TaxID=2839640 RepID=UPI001BE46333|nr:CYTH and CHAD domain-containing protein [Actinomadura sp. NEAU-AAG7]MBT2206668.1 CYTH and CHAD domain-containing protein [Actinomadura sp. NEAU-AAG7]
MALKHLEIEHKFDAAAEFVLPELDGLPGVASVGEPVTYELHASYFDTEDLRLAAQGITLRRRRGGTDAGWHLKMPVGPDSKQELRAALGRPRVVPVRLAGLVAAHTRGAALDQVATLDTERTVVRLYGEDGTMLVEVADDLVTGQDARGGAPRQWREVEVELGDGAPELLKAVGKRLRKSGAKRAASSSKLGRLLDGAVVPSEAKAARAETRARLVALTTNGKAPAVTTGDAVMGYLAAQVEAVFEYDPKARVGEDDAVHRMRVAVRRIRSTLKTYRPVLNVDGSLGEELKWLAAVLGEVRDLEVLRMRFQERLDGAASGWMEELARRERGAYRRLNASLKEPRYFALLETLEELVAHPPLGRAAEKKARKELPVLVTKAWERMAKDYASIAVAEDEDVARHDTRKAAKRARYAAEVAVPVLGVAARRVVKDAKRIQEVLGEHQDGVIAMQHLEEAARRARAVADAFALGVLYGAERCDAEAARDRLAVTWSQTLGPSF